MIKYANTLLVIASVLTSLLFVEIGFRLIEYKNDMNSLDKLKQPLSIPMHGENATLGQIIRSSKNPRIIYEFIPALSFTFKYQPVTINVNGFRGNVVPIHKTPESLRIVGIGDSVMFGWGVKNNETYLSVLSSLFKEKYPAKSVETVNTAVPGYNTVMEVETFKEKGLIYKPDIVIIGYVGNDAELPDFIREEENYFAINKSFIVKYFREKPLRLGFKPSPRSIDNKHYEGDPERVPKLYKNMVGFKAVSIAMVTSKLVTE